MSWLKRLLPSIIKSNESSKRGVPQGLWVKCLGCNAVLYSLELKKNFEVCPQCGYHHRMGARERLMSLLDEETREEVAGNLEPIDRLKFRDSKKYRDRISQAQKASGEKEALIVMKGDLNGHAIVASAFEFSFMGGSMGAVVGEKFVRSVELATLEKRALICFTASGGARMQEGLFSLMQMAKTAAALHRFSETSLPFIVVLTDPTMGGVSASFASLGDIMIAEPQALIGFAGPRVIEQTVRQTLPEGFQRSEFLLEHGHIDMIVPRNLMKETLTEIISKLTESKKN